MKRWLKNNRGFILFLVLLGVFRTAVADWNPIPSGSMRPTLIEGDVVTPTNGCSADLLPAGSFGLVTPKLIAHGDGRTLASSLPDGNGSMCALFVWSLRGVN